MSISSPNDLSPSWHFDGPTGRKSGGSLVTVDGNSIDTWEDQSGNARHSTQVTSGLRPKKYGNSVCMEYAAAVDASTAQYLVVPSMAYDRRASSFFFIVEFDTVNQLGVADATSTVQNILDISPGLALETMFFDSSQDYLVAYENATPAADFTSGSDRRLPSSKALIGFVWGASDVKIIVNDSTITKGQLGAGTVTAVANLFKRAGVRIYSAFALPYEASAGNITDIKAWSLTKGAVHDTTATKFAMEVGDSISAGAANTLNKNWVDQTNFASTVKKANYSTAGQAAFNLFPAAVSALTGRKVAGIPNEVFLAAGGNDFADGRTEAQHRSLITSTVSSLKAAGVDKIYCVTYAPRSDLVGNTEFDNFNTNFRAEFDFGTKPTNIDGLIDWRGDPVYGIPSATNNASLYPDGVHPSDTTSGGMANHVNPFEADTGYTVTNGGTLTVTICTGATFTGNQSIRHTASTGTLSVTAAGGTIANNNTGTVTVTPAAGTTSYTIAPSTTMTVTHTNAQGYGNPAATVYSSVDTTPPTVTLATTGLTLVMTPSEAIAGVTAAMLTLTGGHTIAGVSGSGAGPYTFTLNLPVAVGEVVTGSFAGTNTVFDTAAVPNAMATFSGKAISNTSTLTVPSAPPLVSGDVAVAAGQITITMQPSASDGGLTITTYYLERNLNSGGFEVWATVAASGVGTPVVDDTTANADSVSYRTRSRNILGYSSYSPTVTVTSQGPLEAGTVFASNGGHSSSRRRIAKAKVISILRSRRRR